MTRDIIKIFDKLTRVGTELGEIQSNFNMGLTINGDKDSCKVIVWSRQESEIEPNTICLHEKTNTWWIVKNDKIERLLDENGFVYVHNLQLVGAIELFNARDLTDCGFNQGTYTVGNFIRRLLGLSSLEIDCGNIVANTNFLDKKVEYIKTYENYTLLSALRDFLDGYNMCAKLSFSVYNNQIDDGHITLVPKTGDISLQQHDIDDFEDVRETKTMHQDSFGTTVVSNAENVISSIPKTYPSTGSLIVSGTEYRISPENSVVRLPSNAFKVNWLKFILPYALVEIEYTVGSEPATSEHFFPKNLLIKADDTSTIDKALNVVFNAFHQSCVSVGEEEFYNSVMQELTPQLDKIKEKIMLSGMVTLYNGNKVNAFTGAIEQGENVPYMGNYKFYSRVDEHVGPYILCEKEVKDTLPRKWQGISWERGKNIINGFEGFKAETGKKDQIYVINAQGTDLALITNENNPIFFTYNDGTLSNNFTISFKVPNQANGEGIIRLQKGVGTVGPSGIIINYIPMSDIKIKVDNQRTKRDIQLYNQNGKITDNVALSKILNSYSKEISSDTITRYMVYRYFADVPKVGSFVTKNDELYVVNNVSLDFSQRESNNATPNEFEYFIECEITMSKYVSTKTMMVNPNTNIRDYGIPQNYNVKRKQLYRDYYELNYAENDDTNSSYYVDKRKFLSFGRETLNNNFVTVIKCTYNNLVGGQSSWYYQLETTTFNLNKMFYSVLDFKDNNIIGYGSQNVYSGFVVSRIFSGQTDTLNTPISYTDEDGKVKDFDILFLDIDELANAYNTYEEDYQYNQDYQDWKNDGGSLYNYSVFIPSEIYTLALEDYTLRVTENNYNKDALETPVFEYACQVEDSNDVIVGDNILMQHENCIYFYRYAAGENLAQETVYDNSSFQFLENPTRIRLSNSATVKLVDNKIQVQIHNYTTYNEENNTWEDYITDRITEHTDLAIFRHAYNTITGEEIVELMFIAKKIPNSALSQDEKTLYIIPNHYKLN